MAKHCYSECHYAECHVLFIIILNVIMLSVVMLSVVASHHLLLLRARVQLVAAATYHERYDLVHDKDPLVRT